MKKHRANKMKQLTTYFIAFIIAFPIFAQVDLGKKLSGYVNPEELVTLSASIPFEQAIGVLGKISEKMTGKRIVSTAGFNEPIGIEIDKMPYKKALIVIVQYNALIYEEKAEVIIVKKPTDATSTLSADIYAPITEREVKISALFFEANVTEMRERGVNWSWLLSQSGLSIGSEFVTFTAGQDQTTTTTTGTSEKPPDFTMNSESEFTMGNFTGNAAAAFRFFESENLGEIIARPTVTVRDKNKGRIQIGSDISIKERDFAGNIIDRFYSTGTIIEVTPYIYSEDGLDYVLLKLIAERSTANPGELTTEIAKTQANTEVLMLNGEEKVISGLFVNEEVNNRMGIPLLKDLPWWFFGLRYIFGYDYKQVTKKEIIIVVQAEIVPTLKERVLEKNTHELLRDKIKEDAEFLENYKSIVKDSVETKEQ